MDRIHIHLTDGEIKSLDFLSDTTGLPKSEIIRRAIDKYINEKRDQGVTGLIQMGEIYA